MEFIIISVKDKITGEFMSPQFVHNEEDAKRLFAYQLKNNPIWNENTEQFELYNLGILDTKTGNIVGNDEMPFSDVPIIHPELICKGLDLIDKKGE